MGAHISRRVVSLTLALGCLGILSCQLDKLILPPDDPLPPVLSLGYIDESTAVGSGGLRSVEITLSNPGEYVVSWTALTVAESPWLTLDRTADTTPSSINVSLRADQLPIGSYADTILIARSDRPDIYVNVPVAYEIEPCGVIHIIGDTEISDQIDDNDCGAPHRAGHFAKLFRVSGQPGDSVSVMLESGAFDALLIVAGSDEPEQEPLLELSECNGESSQACIGYLALADANPLYLEVTTETPGGGGQFALRVNPPRAPSVPVDLGQFASEQGSPIPEGGTIPNNEMFIKGTLFDIDPVDSVRLEIEIRTTGTPFLFTATHFSESVADGETPTIHVTDLLDDTDYKWQGRTVDLSGRASDWVTFGSIPEDADFQVRVADAPYAPEVLAQIRSDHSTPVPPGGTINEQTIVLAGAVIDNDESELVRLEVEVRPLASAFQDVPTASSVLVTSGDTASVVVGGLEDGASYHWQARAVDQNGLQGPWAVFSETHGAAFDFRVDIRADHLFVVAQPTGGVAGQQLPVLRVEARKPSGAVDQRFNSAVLVDLTPGTGTPGAVLSGNVLVAAKNGVAEFNNLSIDLAGTNYRLTVLTGGLPPVLTAPFPIREPVPTKIAIVTQPAARAESGAVLAQQPVVEFQDALGSTVVSSNLQVVASVASGPVGELGGTTTMTANATGRIVFTDLALKGEAGIYTLAFSDPSGRVPQVTSTEVTLIATTEIDPASTTATVPAGKVNTATNIIITMRNAAGAAVNGVDAKVGVALARGSANAGATFIISTTGDSTYFATYTPTTAGTDTITVSVNGVAIQGNPFTSVVSSSTDEVVGLSLATQPSTRVQEGKTFPQQPAVALVNVQGATVALAGVRVEAKLELGEEELRGTLESVTDAQGVAVFSDLEIKGKEGFRTIRFFTADGLAVVSDSIEAVKGNPDKA